MALVLCTGVDKALLQTRRYVLEAAGHTVVTVTDELTLVSVCNQHHFDVAVVGQTTGPRMKRRIASLVREHCPQVPLLELYETHIGREIEDADSWLATPVEVPKEFPDRVSELANDKKEKDRR